MPCSPRRTPRHLPGNVVPGDDKRSARLNCISHLLSLIPYEEVPREKIALTERQKANCYEAPHHPYRFIPRKYNFA